MDSIEVVPSWILLFITLVVGPLARGLTSSVKELPKHVTSLVHNNVEKET